MHKKNSKIILFFKTYPSGQFDGIDEFLNLVFNDINSDIGIQINKLNESEYNLCFNSYEIFMRFWQELARSIPGEEKAERPFVMRWKFEQLPSNIHKDELIEVMRKRYKSMHIPCNKMDNTNVFEIRYPSETAYVASYFELLNLSQNLSQSPIQSQPLNILER
jgi:hypothetical protein